jgi:hypothetical protein
MALKLS